MFFSKNGKLWFCACNCMQVGVFRLLFFRGFLAKVFLKPHTVPNVALGPPSRFYRLSKNRFKKRRPTKVPLKSQRGLTLGFD
jgi:hypothetical protein